MKIKKTQLPSVQTSQFELNPQNIIKEQNKQLNDQLRTIERNFQAKQAEFNRIKDLPNSELEKLFKSGGIKDL